MKTKIVCLSTLLALAGCNGTLKTTVNVSDLGNPNSNGKTLEGRMLVELSGKCFEESGVESDALSKADGLLFNLLKNKQERVNCQPSDAYGFKSSATYRFDVALDTIKDGKAAIKGAPIYIISSTEPNDKHFEIRLGSNFKKRLNSRMDDLDSISLSVELSLVNDTQKPFQMVVRGAYVYVGNKYIPIQDGTINLDANSSTSLIYSNVMKDQLLRSGHASLGLPKI